MRNNTILLIRDSNNSIRYDLSSNIAGCLDKEEYLEIIIDYISDYNKDNIISNLTKLRKNSKILFKEVNPLPHFVLNDGCTFISNFYIINLNDNFINVNFDNEFDEAVLSLQIFNEITISPKSIIIISLEPLIMPKNDKDKNTFEYVTERIDLRA